MAVLGRFHAAVFEELLEEVAEDHILRHLLTDLLFVGSHLAICSTNSVPASLMPIGSGSSAIIGPHRPMMMQLGGGIGTASQNCAYWSTFRKIRKSENPSLPTLPPLDDDSNQVTIPSTSAHSPSHSAARSQDIPLLPIHRTPTATPESSHPQVNQPPPLAHIQSPALHDAPDNLNNPPDLEQGGHAVMPRPATSEGWYHNQRTAVGGQEPVPDEANQPQSRGRRWVGKHLRAAKWSACARLWAAYCTILAGLGIIAIVVTVAVVGRQ
ncbi:Uu.00g052070.m01.CDS01 [Anthostomella pinea]|uniref:Uu.00g052070.m01.CDS01 n=1 Tax=Anthostomella pinea TaxID=933095 RepID=A0AAI8VW79_9PEZI|nr:Uu.00g052070.m01.CDS01 [Anthostomella pinea]